MTTAIKINLEGQIAIDIGLLLEYGFDFEKNIEEYLHHVAEDLRKAIKNNKKS